MKTFITAAVLIQVNTPRTVIWQCMSEKLRNIKRHALMETIEDHLQGMQ